MRNRRFISVMAVAALFLAMARGQAAELADDLRNVAVPCVSLAQRPAEERIAAPGYVLGKDKLTPEKRDAAPAPDATSRPISAIAMIPFLTAPTS